MFVLEKCRKPRNVNNTSSLKPIDMGKIDIHDNTLDLTKYDVQNSSKILYHFSKELYTFEKYKNGKKDGNKIKVLYSCKQENALKDVIKQIQCADISRSLANEPSNRMYPEKYCKHIANIFKPYPFINVKIMNTQELAKKGMNLIVESGKGSVNKPYLCIIEMNKRKKNVCLVGKGVCFDSGGIDLKPKSYGMNTDKTGASCVVGIIKYFCNHKKYKNKSIIGILPLTENMPGGNSLKPNDIVNAYNGMSVEIINTDAEGRLILADAIAYSCDKYKPTHIIDFGTLTGTAAYRHFAHNYMSYTENENIARIIKDVCEPKTGERGIDIPSWPEYMVYTKSKVADVQNYDNDHKEGDDFMATMFLRNFVSRHVLENWVHFDICEKGSLSTCNGIYTYIELIKNLLI